MNVDNIPSGGAPDAGAGIPAAPDTGAPAAEAEFFPQGDIDHWFGTQPAADPSPDPNSAPAEPAAPPAAPAAPEGQQAAPEGQQAAPEGQQAAPPAAPAAPDPNAEWLTQADGLLENIGGREYLQTAVDLTSRVFGLVDDGKSFSEFIQEKSPGVYTRLQKEFTAGILEDPSPDVISKVFEKIGLDEDNIDKFKLVDRYGFDTDLLQQDGITQEFLDTCEKDDRKIFMNAPKDIQAEILEAFEKNRPTAVKRMMDAEARDQREKATAAETAAQQHTLEQQKLGYETNLVLNETVVDMINGYSNALGISEYHAAGIMQRVTLDLQSGKNPELTKVADLHYMKLREAVADGNTIAIQKHKAALKALTDTCFRSVYQAEQDKKNGKPAAPPAPAPAPAPVRQPGIQQASIEQLQQRQQSQQTTTQMLEGLPMRFDLNQEL